MVLIPMARVNYRFCLEYKVVFYGLRLKYYFF